MKESGDLEANPSRRGGSTASSIGRVDSGRPPATKLNRRASKECKVTEQKLSSWFRFHFCHSYNTFRPHTTIISPERQIYRAEGALSIESPENIVENRYVLNEEIHYGLQKTVRAKLTQRFVSDCTEGLPVDKIKS